MEKSSSKRDLIMVIVTVLLVLLFGIVLYFDRSGALIARTTPVNVYEDTNLDLVTISKFGPMFNRKAYNAKVQILDGYWEPYYISIGSDKNTPGQLMTAAELHQYQMDVLSDFKIVPGELALDSVNWVCCIKADDYEVTYIIDQETDGNAYLYIFYMK